MDQKKIEELRGLVAAATAGPWVTQNGCDLFTPLGALNAAGEACGKNDGWQIADASVDERLRYVECRANAALIVAAVNSLPALLDEVEALRADAERYRLLREQDYWRPFGRIREIVACFGSDLDAVMDKHIAARHEPKDAE